MEGYLGGHMTYLTLVVRRGYSLSFKLTNTSSQDYMSWNYRTPYFPVFLIVHKPKGMVTMLDWPKSLFAFYACADQPSCVEPGGTVTYSGLH